MPLTELSSFGSRCFKAGVIWGRTLHFLGLMGVSGLILILTQLSPQTLTVMHASRIRSTSRFDYKNNYAKAYHRFISQPKQPALEQTAQFS